MLTSGREPLMRAKTGCRSHGATVERSLFVIGTGLLSGCVSTPLKQTLPVQLVLFPRRSLDLLLVLKLLA